MKGKMPLVLLGIILALGLVVGALVVTKSRVASVRPVTPPRPQVTKVDPDSQPDWVRALKVTATAGRSPNGLRNITFVVTNLKQDVVASYTFVVQYETSNKGDQGALSTAPVDVTRKTEFSRTFDLGSCSTATCVRHDGVTSIDLELDFLTVSGQKATWSGTLSL